MMITHADFGYVQARMQARHGERLDEAAWRRLEARGEVGHLLEAARATPWARWTSHLPGRSDAHAMERALRIELREHVLEVASWTPAAWRDAVEWTAWLASAPAIDRLLGPEPPPAFARADPLLRAFAEEHRDAREAAIRSAGLDPMVDAVARGETARDGWLDGFTARWPSDPRASELRALVHDVEAHLSEMELESDGWALRRALAQRMEHAFRWRAARPVAVWAYLGLVALDLERLRAAVVRVTWFPERSHPTWA